MEEQSNSRCFFHYKEENDFETVHYHLGEVQLNFSKNAEIFEVFKDLKFDLGNSVKDKDAYEAAQFLMEREYDGGIR